MTMTKETLQRLTHFLDMTYQELAEQSGYSFATIDSYMKGARTPSEKLIRFLENKISERLTAGDEALLFVVNAIRKE